MDADKVRGSLLGLAIGDALAAPVEFVSDVAAIRRRYGPDGPAEPSAKVTDDTQMALAVGRAIVSAASSTPLTPDAVSDELVRELVGWLHDPENNRAPGNTCLQACAELDRGVPWASATVVGSKGCGANMRVAPVGLLPEAWLARPEDRWAIAQLQAAMTHGHPTALAASELTAVAVWRLARGTPPGDLLDVLDQHVEARRRAYDERWLGALWQRARAADAGSYAAHGWAECAAALESVRAWARGGTLPEDPCQATGAGWVAEEALATALLCFLAHPDDPVGAVRAAGVTSGDSDSIACLAGAFAGAACGAGAWPKQWCDSIEYGDELSGLASALAGPTDRTHPRA